MELENGLALFARLLTRPVISDINPNVFPQDILHPPLIVEFFGETGTCKSSVCYDLMISTLLPKMWKGLYFNGKDASILYLDCDNNFDILEFKKLIQNRISNLCKINKIFISQNSIDDFYANILSKLIVLVCITSEEFAATLCILDEYVINNCNIALVVIDSISAFYWHDKGYQNRNWKAMESYLNKLLKKLISIIKTNNLILIATKQNLFSKKGSSLNQKLLSEEFGEEFRFLGKVWDSNIDIKVEFSKVSLSNDKFSDSGARYSLKIYKNRVLIKISIIQPTKCSLVWLDNNE